MYSLNKFHIYQQKMKFVKKKFGLYLCMRVKSSTNLFDPKFYPNHTRALQNRGSRGPVGCPVSTEGRGGLVYPVFCDTTAKWVDTPVGSILFTAISFVPGVWSLQKPGCRIHRRGFWGTDSRILCCPGLQTLLLARNWVEFGPKRIDQKTWGQHRVA